MPLDDRRRRLAHSGASMRSRSLARHSMTVVSAMALACGGDRAPRISSDDVASASTQSAVATDSTAALQDSDAQGEERPPRTAVIVGDFDCDTRPDSARLERRDSVATIRLFRASGARADGLEFSLAGNGRRGLN